MSYVSCPTCGLLFADKQIPYEEGIEKIQNNSKLSLKEKSEERQKLLDNLMLFRPCCRMRMMSFTPLEKILTKN